MSNEIDYKEIKVNDITGVAVIGLKTTRGQIRAANNEGDLWTTLVAFLDTKIDWASLENLEDDKKILEALKKVLHQAFLEEFNETKITWSSDERTKAACKYLSDIKKIAVHGCTSVLLPGDNTVAGRCSILSMCVTEKTTLQKMKLAVDKVLAHSEDILDNEAAEALKLYDLMMAEVNRLTALA